MILSTKVLWGCEGGSSKSLGLMELGPHVSEGRHGKFKSGSGWRASGGRHLWTEVAGRQSRLKAGWVEVDRGSRLEMDSLHNRFAVVRSSQGEELADVHSLCFLVLMKIVSC